MTLNNIETLKDKFQRGELCVGSIVTLSDPVVSELVGEAGYDFGWIDMEHSALSLQSVLRHVMALRGTNTVPWVRVAWNDPVLIKPVLEMEPAVIVVPMVRNAEEAAAAVAACRYPPLGVRSYGPSRGVRFGGGDADEYIRAAEDHPLVIVQAEHIDAVNDIDAILATPGLAGVCVGPNDLSGSMGKMGQTAAPDVLAAIDRIVAATKDADKMIGAAIAYSSESVGDWLDKDLNFLAFSSDCLNLYRQAKAIVDDILGKNAAR